MIKTILITGSTGFIGSALVNALLAENQGSKNRLILLYRKAPPKHDCVDNENVVAIKCDMGDYTLLCEILRTYEVTSVYHLAASSLLKECDANPLETYMTNVMGTLNLLEAIKTNGASTIKKIIISTSYKVYGNSRSPYTEETALSPKYTYESSKACQDIISQNYFHSYGLPVMIVRCSNIYGPKDTNTSRLIPKSIIAINKKENPKVHSTAVDFIRNFIHVDDVINAMLLIEEKGEGGDIYCIGGKENISIGSLVTTIAQLMKHTQGIDIIEGVSNNKESKEQSIDSTKLRSLGWNQKYSLVEGLTDCIISDTYK